MKITIKNQYGKEIDFAAAVNLMDDDIRDALCMEDIASDQEFFDLYAERHLAKYGEEWELDKANPVW